MQTSKVIDCGLAISLCRNTARALRLKLRQSIDQIPRKTDESGFASSGECSIKHTLAFNGCLCVTVSLNLLITLPILLVWLHLTIIAKHSTLFTLKYHEIKGDNQLASCERLNLKQLYVYDKNVDKMKQVKWRSKRKNSQLQMESK